MRTEVKILGWLSRPTQRVFDIVLWEKPVYNSLG